MMHSPEAWGNRNFSFWDTLYHQHCTRPLPMDNSCYERWGGVALGHQTSAPEQRAWLFADRGALQCHLASKH